MDSKKIMTHIVAGYPTMKKCEEIALLMAHSGVAYIEIQIPFSDPIADGPVIMRANQKALESGVKVRDCFELMKRLREKFDKEGLMTELLFMSYFNILYKYGVEKFCKKAAECGCYGLIVPDIVIDEEKYDGYLKSCSKHELNAIQIISPLTSNERLKKIGKVARGFVYCVSRFGVTGDRSELNPKLKEHLQNIRRHIELPLAVGFGISNPSHIRAVHKNADIAVIGSKILKMVDEDDLSFVEFFS